LQRASLVRPRPSPFLLAADAATGGIVGAAMSSESYHEPIELLSEATRNMHRAIVSLKEELDAVDWYQQRAEACTDEELRGVLLHNKNEEIEHAMMNLEWIRRHSEVFDANITTYINAKGPILAVEKQQTTTESGSSASRGVSSSLGIGSLKGGK
jgi:ferritin-like protein